MDLYRFIKTHLPGLRILPVSTSQYVPGVILDRQKLRVFGHCREVMPEEPEETWAYVKSEANMIYGTVTADRKLRKGVKVLGLFSLGGGFGHGMNVHLELTDIRGAILQTSQLALQPRINELRTIDRRGRWRLINNRLVVLETFFASAFKATFFRNDQVVGQAEIDEVSGIDIEASVDYQWESGHQLVVTNNASVPFGVRGFVV